MQYLITDLIYWNVKVGFVYYVFGMLSIADFPFQCCVEELQILFQRLQRSFNCLDRAILWCDL